MTPKEDSTPLSKQVAPKALKVLLSERTFSEDENATPEKDEPAKERVPFEIRVNIKDEQNIINCVFDEDPNEFCRKFVEVNEVGKKSAKKLL